MSFSSQTARSLLDHGIAFHRAGRLAEAESAYRALLDQWPAHPDGLRLLGVLALQAGHPEPALDLLTRAVAAAPKAAEPRLDLGNALKALGRLPDAIDAYKHAVRLSPKLAGAHYALGSALLASDEHAAAVVALREAVRLDPKFADAWNNLGTAQRTLKRPGEGEAAYRRAVALAPDNAMLRLNLAIVLAEQEKFADAIDVLREAAARAPDVLDVVHALAMMLVKFTHLEEALPHLERLRATLADPDFATLRYLTEAYSASGRTAEALEAAQAALGRYPDEPSAHSNLGAIQVHLGERDKAAAAFERAFALLPGHSPAHYARALLRLSDDTFDAAAWDDYEHRWAAQSLRPRFDGPVWDGSARQGRTLLVWSEQGLGDHILMARYFELLDPADGEVILEVPPPLMRLFERMPGQRRLIPYGSRPPAHDLRCPIMSLPRAFRSTSATVPARIPYLAADPEGVARWRARLDALPGRKVGLVWAGNVAYSYDRTRSMRAEKLAALAGVPGVSFVSLQLPRPASLPLPMTDWTAELRDFADTADLVGALDLVLGVDTSTINAAAALGRPVWLMNRFAPDWRWPRGKADSPWYPGVRQFRQPSEMDWDSVVRDVRAALTAWAA